MPVTTTMDRLMPLAGATATNTPGIQPGWVPVGSLDMLALLASIPLIVVLGIFVWRHRAMPAALPMMGLLLMRGCWVLCRMQILLRTDVDERRFWFALATAFLVLSVAVGLSVVFEFVRPGTWLGRRNVTFLLLPALVAAVLYVVGLQQRWFWRDLRIEEIIYSQRTQVNWLIAFYFYGYALVAMYALVRFAQRWPVFIWSAAIMLIALSVSVVVDFLLGAGLISRTPIDPGVLAFIFAISMYALAIFGPRAFFDVMPLARETALEQMHDGVAVLNTQGRVVFQNPIAQQLLASRQWRARNEEAEVDARSGVELAALFRDSSTGATEIVDESGSVQMHYAVQITPLNDPRGWRLGNLIVLRDITDRLRAQELLVQQQRTLAIREERERIAAELHDDLGQVLGYVKLQAQATRDLLATNRGEGADQALARLLAVAQDAHTDVREFILGARASSSLDLGFLPALREYLKRFSENFGLPTHLRLPLGREEIEFEPAVAVQLLRIIQEALTNARKHASAGCVTVTFSELDDAMQVVIADDGKGIQLDQDRNSDGLAFGIGLIRRRAESIGGTLEVQSIPNQGTQVIVTIPQVEDAT